MDIVFATKGDAWLLISPPAFTSSDRISNFLAFTAQINPQPRFWVHGGDILRTAAFYAAITRANFVYLQPRLYDVEIIYIFGIFTTLAYLATVRYDLVNKQTTQCGCLALAHALQRVPLRLDGGAARRDLRPYRGFR